MTEVNENSRTSREALTLVVGVSTRPGRYAYLACQMLHDDKRKFTPIGINEGEVYGEKILDMRERPDLKSIHTISLYISGPRQTEYLEYLVGLSPQRIIFNPGTENPELATLAIKNGIFVEEACTLVLIKSKQY